MEYFNPLHRGVLSERWGCGSDFWSYVATLHTRRSSSQGLFAVKVHWEQLVAARVEAAGGDADPAVWETGEGLIADLFPNPVFVRIVRRDIDAQAVSLWRALQSNVWSIGIDDASSADAAQVPYSFAEIDGCRRSIETADACWERLLLGLGVVPYRLTYEQLSSAFSSTVMDLLSHLVPEVTADVPAPRTRPMADDWSVEVIARFRAERGKGSG
jgi:trehalose 2-sulfotransferase